MAVYTNMAWPDDPYGTGQLWRKEPPLLASLAACCVEDGERAVPVSYAVVYLRLHRSRPIDATDGLAFGFRAVSAINDERLPELVRMYDLDAMRARRLARIVTGHRLADDLFAVEATTDGDATGRGIRALADDWNTTGRSPQPGMALMFDTAYDLLEGGELADVAAASAIDPETIQRAFQPQRTLDLLVEAAGGIILEDSSSRLIAERELINGIVATRAAEGLAAYSTERALISALVTARHLERYTWQGDLDIGSVLATNVWDCFTSQEFTPQEQPV
jgi:hypothetical protein